VKQLSKKDDWGKRVNQTIHEMITYIHDWEARCVSEHIWDAIPLGLREENAKFIAALKSYDFENGAIE